jgi:hypothetical protein
VAICFKTEEEIERGETGLLYNYLPTQKSSPFKYVDFHADFHTSVDRKTIEFSKKSKIGQYNSALLKACVELYFFTINQYVTEENRQELLLELIDENTNCLKNTDFDWDYIQINTSFIVFEMVTNILRIWNWNYDTASSLFTHISKQYFEIEREEKEYIKFFENLKEFANYYISETQQYYVWVERFKGNIARKILENEVSIIPGLSIKKGQEILYKDTKEDTVTLPDFFGINITNFRIPDEYFSSCLGIKKYSDINVLFKYFRQISIKGEISEKSISETDQISLLHSLFQLFNTKTDKPDSFAHRYSKFLSESDRKNDSPKNITAFSVSTVFLKTSMGKYKPAQLCCSNELDSVFLAKFIDNEELRNPSGIDKL